MSTHNMFCGEIRKILPGTHFYLDLWFSTIVESSENTTTKTTNCIQFALRWKDTREIIWPENINLPIFPLRTLHFDKILACLLKIIYFMSKRRHLWEGFIYGEANFLLLQWFPFEMGGKNFQVRELETFHLNICFCIMSHLLKYEHHFMHLYKFESSHF